MVRLWRDGPTRTSTAARVTALSCCRLMARYANSRNDPTVSRRHRHDLVQSAGATDRNGRLWHPCVAIEALRSAASRLGLETGRMLTAARVTV